MDKFLHVTGFFILWNLCKPAPWLLLAFLCATKRGNIFLTTRRARGACYKAANLHVHLCIFTSTHIYIHLHLRPYTFASMHIRAPAHKKSCGINPQQKSIPKKQSVFRYCQGAHALYAWFSALLPRKMQNPGTANKRSSNRSAPLLSLPLAHSSAGKNQHDSTS